MRASPSGLTPNSSVRSLSSLEADLVMEDVAVHWTDAKEMGRLIPEADLCGRGLPDLGKEGGVDGDVDLQAIARPATDVMTNLSVGECTGIHEDESPVPADLVIQVGCWSLMCLRMTTRPANGAVCSGASSIAAVCAQLCTWKQLQNFGWKRNL